MHEGDNIEGRDVGVVAFILCSYDAFSIQTHIRPNGGKIDEAETTCKESVLV